MPRLWLTYDLRRPAFARASAAESYAAMLDQCAWADEIGFETVTFGEHHGVDDGYLPSPIVAGAAAGARTKRIRLRLILLCPFYDPLRLAEDLAVLDLASGGRIVPVLGAGYRRVEFEQYGVRKEERRALVEEALEVLKQAWAGEPFQFRGRTVRVTPRPLQSPRPPLISAGTIPPIARRAAHIADGFFGAEHNLWEIFRNERIRLGGSDLGPWPAQGPDLLYVSEDPEKALAQVAPYILYYTNSYNAWITEANEHPTKRFLAATSIEELRRLPSVKVLTPEQCIELGQGLGPDGVMWFKPLVGGLDPELAWASLRLFERKVLPHLDVRRVETVVY